MAYTPSKMNNFAACMRRVMQTAWLGEASPAAQMPIQLGGESLHFTNYAQTTFLPTIGTDANDQMLFNLAVGIPLTAAQIIALSSGVPLVAAPSSAYGLLLDDLVIEFNPGTVAFTGGGVVEPVYTGQTTALTSTTIAASVITGTTQQIIKLGGANPTAILSGTGISLYTPTAFAAGNGTMKAFIRYSVITL